MLLATINSGTLIIALPDLERALGTSILELVWVILAYMIASTVLVLTAGRLSDLFGRKHAYVGGFVVFALASLGAGFAGSGTELILWRIVQGIGGRLPVRQRRRAGDRRLPARAARARHGHQHDDRGRRARHRAGARRGAGLDLLALGLLVQRAARARRRALGLARAARAGAQGRPARLRPPGHRDVRGRAHRARARHLQGRHLGLGRPRRHRRPRRRRRPAAAVGPHRAPRPRADARPHDLREPALRRRHRRRLHQRPVALRAALRLRLLLPGRAGRRPDHRRHQAGADGPRDARRLAAGRHLGRPPRLAHAGRARACSSRRSRWPP